MSSSHLVVGLGGNGGKIIRELRKTIARSRGEAEKSVADFEYVYLDTSDDELRKTDEWQVLGNPVELGRSQWEVNASPGVKKVVDDPGSYPGLKEWIEPRDTFGFVNANTAGAAQKRKLGRLVFAQNVNRFVDMLKDRMRTLEGRAAKEGAIIHVACGLAGGTGSGSVVDVVAQIREQYRDSERYRIVIYALLPERNAKPGKAKTSGGFSNYYANAYAALAELSAMAAGKYHPIDVRNGKRLAYDTYFNGCYLVNDANEHGVRFDVEGEIPRIVSEFIYQKAMNRQWEDLGRAENGENEVKNYEEEAGEKVRAKRFLSFGIERVVVPEEEIEEFMAYSFAEQATRQLMFNNFRQGEGYADETAQKDWRSEVRRPEVLEALLLTDARLTLESGILEDDQKSTLWKPVRDYWNVVGARLAADIKIDQSINQAGWIQAMQSRMAKVYDETYRSLGGVAKFYETKGKARTEMARHIARHVEKDLFEKWRSGQWSLLQLRQFTDAVLESLDERLTVFNAAVGKGPANLQSIHQRIAELSQKFSGVGMLAQMIGDRRERLFADVATLYQDLATVRTTLEGQKFAASLIPLVKDELAAVRGTIDELQQKMATATERVAQERDAQLGQANSVYQKRLFDKPAIDAVVRSMTLDEQGQLARTRQVRRSIIDLAGSETDSFDRLARAATVTALVATLSQESARLVVLAHAELPKNLQPVLHVNIVDRLFKEYDGNPAALKKFVKGLYEEAGCLLHFNRSEIGRSVEGNVGGTSGLVETIGVFLPKCEARPEFRALLQSHFEEQKTPGSNTKVHEGRFSNQILVMKVSSLMPVRFFDGLDFLKQHYDGLLQDRLEAHLLHGEGRGDKLPSLFARTGAETAALRKPTLIAARLLNIVREREIKSSGLKEWVFLRMVDDLPAPARLTDRGWNEVLNGDHAEDIQQAILRAVRSKIDTEYRHVDKKKELKDAYRDLMLERYKAAGEDDQDAEYQALLAIRPAFLSQIVGID